MILLSRIEVVSFRHQEFALIRLGAGLAETLIKIIGIEADEIGNWTAFYISDPDMLPSLHNPSPALATGNSHFFQYFHRLTPPLIYRSRKGAEAQRKAWLPIAAGLLCAAGLFLRRVLHNVKGSR
jgi:hypothetical protein